MNGFAPRITRCFGLANHFNRRRPNETATNAGARISIITTQVHLSWRGGGGSAPARRRKLGFRTATLHQFARKLGVPLL